MCTTITAPEFCPNPQCSYFQRQRAAQHRWYRRAGTYHTLSRGEIQRFCCLACGKSCSTQTFSIHYWSHSDCDLRRLREDLDSASGLRQIARRWRVSYRVVQNRIRRLARNALTLLHTAAATSALNGIAEHLVIDGFESFVRSQYFPAEFNLVVGKNSQYLYGFSFAALRRKGRMSALQRSRRAMIDAHYSPPARSVFVALRMLLDDLSSAIAAGCRCSPRVIYSDEHRSYPAVLRSLPQLHTLMLEQRLQHLQISSRRARTTANRLFAVNYLDRQIRKNCGEHARETVKQAREVNCSLERMAIFALSHNFFTPHRISNRADTTAEPTHADAASIANAAQVTWLRSRLFTHRHLHAHLRSPGRWISCIWRHLHENPSAVDFTTAKRSPQVMGLAPSAIAAHLAT
ncbi:MAG: hypothetical protein EA384_03340 [Spirochaetaceae bacterium]|nr:MAG: hypothetical protein EA384_03340 [Spirochaetaceae bacterium]